MGVLYAVELQVKRGRSPTGGNRSEPDLGPFQPPFYADSLM